MLQSVRVHVNKTAVVGDSGFNQLRLGLGVGVDASVSENVLDGFTRVHVLHNSHLLSNVVFVGLDHFPAKVHFNTSLVALLEGELVCVWEFEDLLIRSPVLDLGVIG